jgi:hypothetical protein
MSETCDVNPSLASPRQSRPDPTVGGFGEARLSVGEVARRDARKNGGQLCRRGVSDEGEHLSSGDAGHRGGRAEPPPLRGGARRGLPAAGSAPPVRSALGTRRNDRVSWASARTAIGHDHQGDNTKPRGLIRRSSNRGTCAVQGEDRSPNRHRESLMSPGTHQERFASLRDAMPRS